jgi:bifunctional enzyme CysN/CysC/sulfate adenylyltransferase subunit 1
MAASSRNGTEDGFARFLERDLSKDLLRFTTAGSVDDGKSTLIGRLLHDSKSVYEDQLASVKKSRINRSGGPIDFALLTDGLRAEREQGITIDVAYRYFATARRKFIIADTPGHEQYTRNMATGASTADLAVILIDASKGLLPQTRRHAYIASLLGITHVLAAVNKMDLMGFREDVFAALKEDFLSLASRLGIARVQCIPISALEGDNVVERSRRMPWYAGPSLLEHLETVPLYDHGLHPGLRFPIQLVIRPDAEFRGFAGRVAGGQVRPGDPVVALPSRQKSRVRSITAFDGNLPQASESMSVTLQLEDEIDLSRGDMLVSPWSQPAASRDFTAGLVWLHASPLEAGRTYLLKHTSRLTKARVTRIRHRVNINSITEEDAATLEMNDIGLVEFQTNIPLHFDPYTENRVTGSFILIDSLSNATLGAGMIRENLQTTPGLAEGIHQAAVTPEERFHRQGHYPGVVIVESGSSSLHAWERTLFDQGCQVIALDSPVVRPAEMAPVIEVAKRAGLILLISGAELDTATKAQIAAAAGPNFFDLTATGTAVHNQDVLQRLLAIADSLRIAAPPRSSDKVN